MIIYENTKGGFVDEVRHGSIAARVKEQFDRLGLGHNNFSEYQSWNNSLMYMRNVLDDAEIEENEKGGLVAKEWVENYIPTLTAFILEGTPNTTYTFTKLRANDQDETITSNVLRGHTEDKSLALTQQENDGADIYVFSRVSGQYGFYKFAGSTLQAHKAYYAQIASTDVQGFALDFEGDQTTGVSIMRSENDPERGNQYFDLSGRAFTGHPKHRGLCIMNGRKVIK